MWFPIRSMDRLQTAQPFALIAEINQISHLCVHQCHIFGRKSYHIVITFKNFQLHQGFSTIKIIGFSTLKGKPGIFNRAYHQAFGLSFLIKWDMIGYYNW